MGRRPEDAGAVGIGIDYSPRQLGHLGKVLPVDYVTETADGLGQQQGWGCDIGQTTDARQVGSVGLSHEWEHRPPRGQEPFGVADHDIGGAAYKASDDGAVDRDTSRPDREHAEEVVSVDFVPKVDDMKESGADYTADDSPNSYGVDGIDDHPIFSAPAGHQPDGDRNGHKGQKTMPRKSYWPGIYQVRIYAD